MSSGRDEFESGTGSTAFDDTLEWDEVVRWLRKHTVMEIWLKGVTSPEDVEKAILFGVDGIIISNHGGRQLDGMPATLDVLRQCAPIANGRTQIAIDGGIRRGSDIFKALALGAQFSFVGRIPIWGLAVRIALSFGSVHKTKILTRVCLVQGPRRGGIGNEDLAERT